MLSPSAVDQFASFYGVHLDAGPNLFSSRTQLQGLFIELKLVTWVRRAACLIASDRVSMIRLDCEALHQLGRFMLLFTRPSKPFLTARLPELRRRFLLTPHSRNSAAIAPV